MSERIEVEYALTVNVEDASTQLRQLERILFRSLALLRRMGLPEDVEAGIMRLQRLITIVRSAQIALIALQAARMAAGDPLAWIQAGLGVATTVASASDLVMDMGYRG